MRNRTPASTVKENLDHFHHLQEHEKIHTDEKQFSCEKCIFDTKHRKSTGRLAKNKRIYWITLKVVNVQK